MDKVNKQILHFYEEGLFGKQTSIAGSTTVKEVEAMLYEGGLKKFMKQMKINLIKKAREAFNEIPASINLFAVNSGIYLFNQQKEFLVFGFKEESSFVERIEELSNNLEKIEASAFEIVHREFSLHIHNTNAFSLMLTQLIQEKQKEGFFESAVHYFSPPEEISLTGTYYPQGSYLVAKVFGVMEPVKEEREGYDPRILKRKKFTHPEAYQLLVPVVDTLIEKFKTEPFYSVQIAVRKEFEVLYKLSTEQMKKMIYSKDYRDDVTVSFGKIIIPINVDSSGVAKAAQYAKALDYLDQQSEEVREVTRHFTISSTRDFHLSNGILPFTFSIEDAEVLVELIETRLEKTRAFIESGTLENRPNKLPSFGRAFFLRFGHEFDYKGSTFQRYEYRLPNSKKTKSLMYENGKRISANRYFRILRKYRKQA